MGNEQSAPTPRRTNKLSKPRTNSSGILLNAASPVLQNVLESQSNLSSPTKSKYSLPSVDGGETGDERQDPRRKRRSFFRSRSSQSKARQLEIETGVKLELADPSPVERPIRRRSTAAGTYDHSPERVQRGRSMRMSLQHAPYSQHHPRLSLVAETQSPPLEKAAPLTNTIYGQPDKAHTSNSLLSRTDSDAALYVPIRRRSLQQHGVATRTSYVENDPRQSLPSQVKSVEEIQNYYYNPAKPTTSPLSSFAAMGYDMKVSTPEQRVQTPNDLDYGHIGAFKLGSLRITNGAASPAPSDGRSTTAGADEDYLTFQKHGQSNHRHGLSQRSNTLAVPNELIRQPWTTNRSESPLRQTHHVEHEPLSVNTQLPTLDPSLGLFDFRSKHSPTKSLDLANEYMQDLALSPFSFENSPTPSPKLEATSKHMAVEDDLFEAEPMTPPLEPPKQLARSFDSGYGTNESRVVRGPREPAPKPLAKADSGYSSNISLRSFKKDTGPIVPAKDGVSISTKESVLRVASSTYSESPSEIPIQPEKSLPDLPVEFPPLPVREAPPVPPKQPSVREQVNETPPTLAIKSEGRPHIANLQAHTRQQSLPAIPRAVREPQVSNNSPSGSDESMLSHSSGSRGNKVQKRRPQSMQPTPIFTVQATRSPSEIISIPPVPAEVERKLVERVESFPVACFPNTLANTPTLKRTVSKETLGTIFSVGSAEVRDEINFARLQGKLPPVPASIPEHPVQQPASQPKLAEKPLPNRRATFQASSTNSLPFWKSFDRRRSMKSQPGEPSPAPRKSIEQQQEEYETHVTSFETITASLGKSPYDVGVRAICRPQSSNANARARSMTAQFEADASARFQKEPHNLLPHYEKPPPPVSMHTRRIVVSASVQPVNPPSRAPLATPTSVTPPPNRPAPEAPHISSMMGEKEAHDPWAEQKSFWAERRKSAGKALQTKKSMDMQRPAIAPLNHANESGMNSGMDARRPGSARAPVDQVAEAAMRDGMSIRRSESARPSHQYSAPQQTQWDGYGYETNDHWDQNQNFGEYSMPRRNYSGQWEEEQTVTYDHTYGSSPAQANQEDEYYTQTGDVEIFDHDLPRNVYARQNSTEEMLCRNEKHRRSCWRDEEERRD
ncbi:hypothetical protein G7Y89_g13382 [Cudoniella acicularis]|uniref:Uncharacterized protein n=1 Tax=Cudoniella acicularis TaxID=354080 RepID=A0A8H4R7E2_9HELO|nr:hypothetical protein G7Y89_g13382 [Cudoniella acicularis]